MIETLFSIDAFVTPIKNWKTKKKKLKVLNIIEESTHLLRLQDLISLI